jgi:dipeptidyl aminopeptidase/acylaminoacyl peptidase
MTLRVVLCLCAAWSAAAQPDRISSADLYKLRSVGAVRISPDGSRIAYAVNHSENPGRPYSRLHIRETGTGRDIEIAGPSSSNPVWSADGRMLAYTGTAGGKRGLIVASADGSGAKFVAELDSTNAPLPHTGATYAWSPDGKQIAFVSARPGPETAEASGDPVVITRYLYKPDFAEGNTRFNDNKRLHIFVADLATGAIRQLTDGVLYEHFIDWSPNGEEILFVSNREPDSDQFFNYDVFALRVRDASIRRITATESAEYTPQWSPDGRRILFLGTRRGLTDLETTMEDTHVWVMDSDGGNRRELGAAVDNRQLDAGWSPDGEFIYVNVQERGSVHLYRLTAAGGAPLVRVGGAGAVGSWSVAKNSALAYAFTTPRDTAQLYLQEGSAQAKRLTDWNAAVLAGKAIAPVEAFTFVSNDFKWDVEAFLTRPIGQTADSRHPLIVTIHGGPHAQQGPAFNFKAQVYAALGWAVLFVNYRGSTGYGQKFADAVFGDQNGNEGQDVLYAVSAAVRRNPWIDRNRLGVEGASYGGQLSAWLVTQTHIFKAAIPQAPIINLVSYNYMTYYNMYEQMEFGVFPHQGDLMDTLWKRSSLRYVAQVKTPVMLLHGENDNDVCIAESEQFYIGLKDAGVETVMVRYPREGHGLRESKHIVDSIDRSVAWFGKHFPK